MSWASALKKIKPEPVAQFARPALTLAAVDWSRLVTVDFETFYSSEYTLSKSSTSEYVRDPRFKAQMVGIKIGNKATRIYAGPAKVKAALQAINWATHSLLAHNCLLGDVEVLTRDGWKTIKDTEATTEIMQWCPRTRDLTWTIPLGKTVSFSETLLLWDTNLHRCAYTPEHRLYYSTPDRRDWRAKSASELAQMSPNNTYVPLSGTFESTTPIVLSPHEARLMEAVRADGSWMMAEGTCYGAQFRFKKPAKQMRIRALASKLGLRLTETVEGDVIRFRLTTSDLIRRIYALLGADKEYGQWVLDLPLDAKREILKEARYWDGHSRGTPSAYSWSCANENTVSALQLLAHTTGWSMSGSWADNARGFNEANIGAKLYRANVSQKSRAKLVTNPTVKQHNAEVYCFTVPTGAFLIRSNDRVLVTGNCQFDGFIMSHHYGIVPAKYYDTLSMARGLHSNEIGASLNEVAEFYGKGSKIDGALETSKGVLVWTKQMNTAIGKYCAQDVDLCHAIFKEMHAKFPADEMDLVDMTVRMFCDPVLKLDLPRVQTELTRELDRREKLFYAVIDPAPFHGDKVILKNKAERALEGVERDMLIIKRIIGSNEKFAELLRAESVEPPVKISPVWMTKTAAERDEDDKYVFAFAKDDIKFTSLPDNIDAWRGELDLNKKTDVPLISAKQDRIRALVDCRIAVKSTTNVTRAQRFLVAGADGMSLPCGYAYARAHTLRWGGNNKMNMQNLTRGGELRLSILAPKGHQLAVCDSGQIEARVNGWLWGQHDLLDAFRAADAGTGRDAYCNFADHVYGRTITKDDKMERFVGKVCVLGLGFQMGAPKFQMTLAKGALGGPPVYFELDHCREIVSTYRLKNYRIQNGWSICKRIIDDMAEGREGAHGPLSWEANTIWLPNGMCLKYPDLRKRMGDQGWEEWSYQSGQQRAKIYGGLLCENIVQCLARIIVGWQTLQISRKHRIVMITHDEAVACVKTAKAEAAFGRMMKWFTTAPAWCADLPLNAEGGWAANYSK